jgi:hypothetical protein
VHRERQEADIGTAPAGMLNGRIAHLDRHYGGATFAMPSACDAKDDFEMNAPTDLYVKVVAPKRSRKTRYFWEIYRGSEPKPIKRSAGGFFTQPQAASAGQLALLRVLHDSEQ